MRTISVAKTDDDDDGGDDDDADDADADADDDDDDDNDDDNDDDDDIVPSQRTAEVCATRFPPRSMPRWASSARELCFSITDGSRGGRAPPMRHVASLTDSGQGGRA